MVLEIEEKGIGYNDYSFYIRLSAYAAVSDCKGIKKMVTMMESNPNFVVDLSVYAIAASGYARAGFLDKTYAMLKKCEGLATGGQDRYPPYDFLISKYAEFGNKDDVLRVWEFCKKNSSGWKVAGSVIPSVLKFDDLEIAEKILEEVNWPKGNPHYCIHVINPLIAAYCRKGLLGKAEAIINNAQSRGLNPDVRTWYLMATGYLQNDQTEKAMEAMKKSICETGIGWIPSKECLAVFLKWF